MIDARGQERSHETNPSPLFRDLNAMVGGALSDEAFRRGEEFVPDLCAAGMATLAFGASLGRGCIQQGIKVGRTLTGLTL